MIIVVLHVIDLLRFIYLQVTRSIRGHGHLRQAAVPVVLYESLWSLRQCRAVDVYTDTSKRSWRTWTNTAVDHFYTHTCTKVVVEQQ